MDNYRKTENKKLDGAYRMLLMVLNVTWRDGLTKELLYRNLCPVSNFTKQYRIRFGGYSRRAKDEIASEVGGLHKEELAEDNEPWPVSSRFVAA